MIWRDISRENDLKIDQIIKGENKKMNIFKKKLKQVLADSQRIEAAKILLGTEDENLRMSLCEQQEFIQQICRENLQGIKLLKRG